MFLRLYYIEFKNRSFLLFLSWICSTITCCFYKEVLLILVIKSTCNLSFYKNVNLYFILTDVKELFNVYFKLIFFISNPLCIVVLTYHLFMFFYLGLYSSEYTKIKKVLKTIFINFLITIPISYICIIPLSWYFFLEFQTSTNNINLVSFFFEAKISEYFDFIYQMYSICFLSFQIAGLSFLILNNVFIEINNLKIKFVRKIFYFLFIMFSTLITPPDVFSQLILSFCFILCYEFFVLIKIKNLLK